MIFLGLLAETWCLVNVAPPRGSNWHTSISGATTLCSSSYSSSVTSKRYTFWLDECGVGHLDNRWVDQLCHCCPHDRLHSVWQVWKFEVGQMGLMGRATSGKDALKYLHVLEGDGEWFECPNDWHASVCIGTVNIVRTITHIL